MNNDKENILIIDDEKEIRKLLHIVLSTNGYKVEESENGNNGIARAAFLKPNLILLDLSLPDIDGLKVLKRIREFSKNPIIILSVREQESSKITALDSGADDYVTKPFSPGELLARIRAAIRHSKKEVNEPVIIFEGLNVDLLKRVVKVGKEDVKLSPIEYEILKILAQNKDKIVTQKYLLEKVWGPTFINESHYLRIYISQIRKKIEKNSSRPEHLLTEPGIGYRLV
ncbi:MAG: response regulator [Actinobacteria bacterium]|nr:response regulator [Actinomycetota bacterium]MCL5069874.1 response regulator [Actinomycetota bacterium]